MSGELSPRQRQIIRKRTRSREVDPSEMVGELNIVPFLDIVVNLIIFLLMTAATLAFFSQIEARLPEYGRGVGKRGTKPDESLNLNVTVTPSGIIVSGSGGKLEPGCETTTANRVLTVGKKPNGEYDWEALSACLTKVKSQFPDEEQAVVSADPVVEYQYLVRAMDVVRARGDKPLFPTLLLSAGIR